MDEKITQKSQSQSQPQKIFIFDRQGRGQHSHQLMTNLQDMHLGKKHSMLGSDYSQSQAVPTGKLNALAPRKSRKALRRHKSKLQLEIIDVDPRNGSSRDTQEKADAQEALHIEGKTQDQNAPRVFYNSRFGVSADIWPPVKTGVAALSVGKPSKEEQVYGIGPEDRAQLDEQAYEDGPEDQPYEDEPDEQPYEDGLEDQAYNEQLDEDGPEDQASEDDPDDQASENDPGDRASDDDPDDQASEDGSDKPAYEDGPEDHDDQTSEDGPNEEDSSEGQVSEDEPDEQVDEEDSPEGQVPEDEPDEHTYEEDGPEDQVPEDESYKQAYEESDRGEDQVSEDEPDKQAYEGYGLDNQVPEDEPDEQAELYKDRPDRQVEEEPEGSGWEPPFTQPNPPTLGWVYYDNDGPRNDHPDDGSATPNSTGAFTEKDAGGALSDYDGEALSGDDNDHNNDPLSSPTRPGLKFSQQQTKGKGRAVSPPSVRTKGKGKAPTRLPTTPEPSNVLSPSMLELPRHPKRRKQAKGKTSRLSDIEDIESFHSDTSSLPLPRPPKRVFKKAREDISPASASTISNRPQLSSTSAVKKKPIPVHRLPVGAKPGPASAPQQISGATLAPTPQHQPASKPKPIQRPKVKPPPTPHPQPPARAKPSPVHPPQPISIPTPRTISKAKPRTPRTNPAPALTTQPQPTAVKKKPIPASSGQPSTSRAKPTTTAPSRQARPSASRPKATATSSGTSTKRKQPATAYDNDSDAILGRGEDVLKAHYRNNGLRNPPPLTHPPPTQPQKSDRPGPSKKRKRVGQEEEHNQTVKQYKKKQREDTYSDDEERNPKTQKEDAGQARSRKGGCREMPAQKRKRDDDDADGRDPDTSAGDRRDDQPQGTTRKRAKRNSINPTPTGNRYQRQYGSFPEYWQGVTDDAVDYFRLLIALKNSFPDRETSWRFARQALSTALQDRRQQGLPDTDEWFNARGKLNMLHYIRCDRSTFRSTIRAPADTAAQARFKLRDTRARNFNQTIRHFLNNGRYLHRKISPDDPLGLFQNEAILDVSVNFFYTNHNGLARIFPNQFTECFPMEALGLSAISLCHHLEWLLNNDTTFRESYYRNTYDDIMKALRQIRDGSFIGQHDEQLPPTERRNVVQERQRQLKAFCESIAEVGRHFLEIPTQPLARIDGGPIRTLGV